MRSQLYIDGRWVQPVNGGSTEVITKYVTHDPQAW
ncbi:hypothetical protein ABID26_007331 [Mesorhizobium shonense]|uniref:Aldehyde dehydrogenase n=1 Tax=Mesorhizobium shonense TaxID=1209948 RepID=A0ABV2I4T0_9HYPH